MPKKKQKLDKKIPILYGIIVLLAIACAVLIYALVHTTSTPTTSQPRQSVGVVNLGPMQYHIVNGRATVRTDAAANRLRAFLQHEANISGCPATAPGAETVIATTTAETQAYVMYGCGAADAPMYVVLTDGKWQALTPTNHFGGVNYTPVCSYVDANHISNQIAPICIASITASGPSAYTIR